MEAVTFFIGVIATAAAGYFFVYKKKLEPKIAALEENAKADEGRIEKALALLDSIHSTAFGAAGVHPQVLKDAFNEL